MPPFARRERLPVAPPPAALVLSASVSYDVRISHAGPRALAAVRATTTRQRLGADIIGLLDVIWPVLRAQGVRTGHNVVVYYGGHGGTLAVGVGVEVFSDFAAHGEIQRMSTPSGEVAATAHYGEYSDLGAAYAALEQWCTGNQRRPTGVNWEVYGDWEDDPALRRTEVYFLLEPATPGMKQGSRGYG
jgi:effector-binding domain-containing protein